MLLLSNICQAPEKPGAPFSWQNPSPPSSKDPPLPHPTDPFLMLISRCVKWCKLLCSAAAESRPPSGSEGLTHSWAEWENPSSVCVCVCVLASSCWVCLDVSCDYCTLKHGSHWERTTQKAITNRRESPDLERAGADLWVLRGSKERVLSANQCFGCAWWVVAWFKQAAGFPSLTELKAVKRPGEKRETSPESDQDEMSCCSIWPAT